ncbi:MAG TPA: UbiA family prenyltransferase [Croceibacterium sp.]|nr:UbiA family prenyltransferase [Croceibacterium sp.]
MSIANWDPTKLTLVVDLDDTLIQTDSLFETFWSACSVKWHTPLGAASALLRGPLALKQQLAEIAEIDPARLPYNDDVLEVIRDWRARGGRVALVTASVQSTADAVAGHLGLFDEAHGSADGINLKGANKARFLQAKFGGGYTYIGDAAADLPVWERAAHAVTVNPNRAFRARVDALGKETEHLAAGSARARDYLRVMRPHQWLKNVLVFAPMLASHQLTPANVVQSLLAFVAFSLVASSTYVLNDLLDLAADRAHPRKRSRPFASGAVKVSHGTWMAPALGLLGAAVALASGPGLLAMLAAYFVATTLYSFWLKRLVAIDVCVLAVLYTMRILAGSVATGIPASVWLLAFSTFFFFALAAVKRQAELVDGIASGTVRARGRGYHVDDLSIVSNLAVSSGLVSVLVLALYANSEPVQQLYRTPEVLWGILPVLLFWHSRIAILTNRGQMHDDPLVFAARDPVSHCCIAAVGALALAGTWL